MNRTLIILSAFFVAACSAPNREAGNNQNGVNELPDLILTTVTGERVPVKSLKGNTVLIFYTPGCDHCQREAQAIRNNLEEFRNYSIYFIAANPLEEINQFAKEYLLVGHDNVIFAQAEVADVMRVMGPFETPALCIYSDEKKLVKRFDGETKMEEIMKFL